MMFLPPPRMKKTATVVRVAEAVVAVGVVVEVLRVEACAEMEAFQEAKRVMVLLSRARSMGTREVNPVWVIVQDTQRVPHLNFVEMAS